MKEKRQMSETFLLGLILASVGGFLDAYTYLCRGGVFANAQTGNIVLLGVTIAKLDFVGAISYVVPIVAFVSGIFVSEAVKYKYKNNSKIHWRQIIIAVEVIVLVIVSFLPETHSFNVLANVMVSFVCSLQVQSFRKINGNAVATTMCTGNLRSATELLCKSIKLKDKSKSLELLQKSLQYFAVIVAFIIGATIGAVLTGAFGVGSLTTACTGLAVVFCLMFIERL